MYPNSPIPSLAVSRVRAADLIGCRLALCSAMFSALMLPAFAQSTSAPATPPKDDDVVTLSPFVVNSEQDNGYQATNTLAGTRLNTDLKDVGAAVSVYTKEFLDDISVTKLQDILTFTASTEAAGQNGNFSGVTGENAAEVRDDPSSVNRVRALAAATRTRDFFPTDIPGDTYNFDTLTVSRGPNAILAGVGNAGGVIDSAMRKATFKDSYRFASRFSSYNSHREEAHFNKVIIPKKLAIRVDAVNDDKNYRQDPAYESDRRLYVAMQYRLIEPKRGSILGSGTLRGNFERGQIEGVPPDPLTPTFTIDNWFNPTTAAGVSNPANAKYQWWGYGNQSVVPSSVLPTTLVTNATAANVNNSALRTATGAGIVLNPNNSSVVQGFPLYAQMALIYADPTSSTASVGFTDPSLAGIQGFQGTIPATLPGGTGGSLRSSGDFNRLRTGYVRTRLQDPNIFNFYDNLMTGAFDHHDHKFRALDLRYEQLLFGGKAGVEVAYNNQSFTKRRDFSIPTGGNDEGIMVDVNYYLSVKSSTGQPILNPNFGRPFISTTDVFRDQMNRIDRNSGQLTAFFKHDFTQSESKWVRLLGRHTVSGLLFKTDIDRSNRTYSSTWDTTASPSPQASLNGAAPGTFGTQVNGWFYLGPSLVNVANVSDIRLSPITATRPQYGQTYKVQVYDPVSKTFVTANEKPLRIIQNLTDQRENLRSTAVALQSNWLNDYLVTVVGWREDIDKNFIGTAPTTRLANGSLDESAVTFAPSVAQGKRSWTKSVVGRLPVKLPWGTELRAFWNESGNFNPIGQRRNIWNEELGSPNAKTTEKGITLSAFNGKLYLRINRYNTQIQGDSVSNVGNPYTYISTEIGRMLAARDAGLNPANFNYLYPGWSSFADVAQAIYNTIPDRLKANIGASKNFNPNFTGSGSTLQWNPASIINLASVSNTESRGTEYEIVANPVRGWRIAFSAARNEAVKSDVAAQELAFADAWYANLSTMYDGKLLPGARNPAANETGTFWAQYQSETLPSIRSAAALSGAATPEIRKWRMNFVTNYEIQRGFLRGLSIGGAVRWQDKIGIGYPYITQNGLLVADVTKPYYGPSDTQVDASLGYKHRLKILGGNVMWAINLNVRNLNAKDELIPIAANADGTWGTFRIPPERTWSITNSFSF